MKELYEPSASGAAGSHATLGLSPAHAPVSSPHIMNVFPPFWSSSCLWQTVTTDSREDVCTPGGGSSLGLCGRLCWGALPPRLQGGRVRGNIPSCAAGTLGLPWAVGLRCGEDVLVGKVTTGTLLSCRCTQCATSPEKSRC